MKKQFKNLKRRRTGCPIGSAKARQIGLLRRAQETSAAIGCPIDIEQTAEFPMLPQCRADQGEEAGKAVRPLTQPGAEAQQDIPDSQIRFLAGSFQNSTVVGSNVRNKCCT